MKTLTFNINQKMLIAGLIISLQLFFLYGYYYNQDYISYFRASYIRDIYLPIFLQKTSVLPRNLGSVLQFGDKGHHQSANVDKGQAYSVPVLVYHGAVDSGDGSNIVVSDFRKQMFALKAAGWQTISIYDFYDFLRSEKTLPEKSFLLTFDDGRKDSYYPVDPILKTLDYRAVMFVITSRTDNQVFHLSKRELERMMGNGRWDLQSHGNATHDFATTSDDGEKGHLLSSKIWLKDKSRIETTDEYTERITNDFRDSKKWLEETTGKPIVSYAFPFGDYGQGSANFATESTQLIKQIVRSLYPISFYQIWEEKGSAFNYPDPNTFMVKRISVKSNWSADELVSILEGGNIKNVPYQENFDNRNSWKKAWGDILFVDDKSMLLRPREDGTDNLVYLDGSNLWSNYFFKANIDLKKGETVSLVARYVDNNNYVTCGYSDQNISITQYVEGKRTTLLSYKTDIELKDASHAVGTWLNGDRVNCYLDGKNLSQSAVLDKALSHGGIGLKVWDRTVGTGEASVSNIGVVEITEQEREKFLALPEFSNRK